MVPSSSRAKYGISSLTGLQLPPSPFPAAVRAADRPPREAEVAIDDKTEPSTSLSVAATRSIEPERLQERAPLRVAPKQDVRHPLGVEERRQRVAVV